MHDIFKGFLRLRLLAFIPLLIVIVVLLGVSALTRGSTALGTAILAGVAVFVVAALGRLIRGIPPGSDYPRRRRLRSRSRSHAPTP